MSTIYIAITTEQGQLVIDGPLFNFCQLLEALKLQTESPRPTLQETQAAQR